MQSSKLQEPEIVSIFATIGLVSSSDFSVVLQPFKKRYSQYGPIFDKDEAWLAVFEKALSLYKAEERKLLFGNDSVRYNLLRFFRLLAGAYSVQIQYHNELGTIYWSTVYDLNGKIRNAGYQLLVNMQFGLPKYSEDKKTKSARCHWMYLFFTLLDAERDYETRNKRHLSKSELTGRKWRKLAVNTQDKFLKNIRRGIELIDRGFYFDEILEEFRMLEKVRSSEALREYYLFKEKSGESFYDTGLL